MDYALAIVFVPLVRHEVAVKSCGDLKVLRDTTLHAAGGTYDPE